MTPELQKLVEQRTAELEVEMHSLPSPTNSRAYAQADARRIQALLDDGLKKTGTPGTGQADAPRIQTLLDRRPRADRPSADFDAIPVDTAPVRDLR